MTDPGWTPVAIVTLVVAALATAVAAWALVQTWRYHQRPAIILDWGARRHHYDAGKMPVCDFTLSNHGPAPAQDVGVYSSTSVTLEGTPSLEKLEGRALLNSGDDIRGQIPTRPSHIGWGGMGLQYAPVGELRGDIFITVTWRQAPGSSRLHSKIFKLPGE